MDREKIISLSKICGEDGYPSRAGEKIIRLMKRVPAREWDLEMTVAFAKAANVTQSGYDFDDLYELLESKKQEGIADYEWNAMMANILFNLQGEECVQYMRQALIAAGRSPDICYDEVIVDAWEKVNDGRGDELTDEEMLALYMEENPA